MQKLYKWFVYSSANSQEIALTIKAGIPFLALLGLGQYIPADQAENIVDLAFSIFTMAGQILTGVYTLYGAIRKIALTFRQ